MKADTMTDLRNLKRRTARARNAPGVTCPASRHVELIACSLAAGGTYPTAPQERMHCAESLLAVLEALWKARAELARVKGETP